MAHAASAGHGASAGAGTPEEHYEPLPLSPRRRRHLRDIPPNEVVYGIYHTHIFVYLRSLVLPIVIVLSLALLLLGVNAFNPADVPGWLLAILSVADLLIFTALFATFVWAVYRFIDWRADHLIVTDGRVVTNLETPGIRRQLNDVPMDKVQNVSSHEAGLDQLMNKLVGISTLSIDTAGQGHLEFDNMATADADEARGIIAYLQSDVRRVNKEAREDFRRGMVDHYLLGTPRPHPPHRVSPPHSYRHTGYQTLNLLFPRRPWREGRQSIWHRHWWFLIKSEAALLLLILTFELTSLLAALIGQQLGLPSPDGVDVFLAIVRPFFYGVLLLAVLWQWANWRSDQYILDNDRLETINTLPFNINRTVTETEIRRVVDAVVTVHGLAANILRFGNIVVKTPADMSDFIFQGVPNPFEVHHEIMNRVEYEREREQAQADRDAQEWVRILVEEELKARPQPEPPQPVAEDGFPLFW